jgi:DNA-binding Xre family transcriptional regulator
MVAQPHFDPAPVIRAMAIQGYIIETLAAKAGCSKNAIWKITNAKSARPRHLHAVCKILGVSVEACYPIEEGAGRK